MSEKTWCKEHITERNNWFVTKSGKKIEIQDDWQFCPVCAAPRPLPKKSLAEKLRGAYPGSVVIDVMAVSNAQAKTAVEHFSEIVDEWADEIHQSGVSLRDELKKKFAESLGRES